MKLNYVPLLPLQREHEVLTDNEYTWDAKAVPDGYYRVRVDASDELSNPDAFALHRDADQ